MVYLCRCGGKREVNDRADEKVIVVEFSVCLDMPAIGKDKSIHIVCFPGV